MNKDRAPKLNGQNTNSKLLARCAKRGLTSGGDGVHDDSGLEVCVVAFAECNFARTSFTTPCASKLVTPSGARALTDVRASGGPV